MDELADDRSPSPPPKKRRLDSTGARKSTRLQQQAVKPPAPKKRGRPAKRAPPEEPASNQPDDREETENEIPTPEVRVQQVLVSKANPVGLRLAPPMPPRLLRTRVEKAFFPPADVVNISSVIMDRLPS